MQHEPATCAVDILDPTMMAHISEHTDLIARYQQVTGKALSTHGLKENDDFINFAIDEIRNGATEVESFDRIVEMYGEDESFPHMVMEFQGVFFYQSMDYDDVGYWLNRQDAADYAHSQANP